MNASIWEIIANTPWWVYALFVFLVRIGMVASKPRVVPFKTLFVFPSILIALSVISLFSVVVPTVTNISIWFGAVLLGVMLGWLRSQSLNVQAVKGEGKIYIPGSWSLLLFILLIFTVRYYVALQSDIDPNMLIGTKYSQWAFSVYGLFSGVFVGRMVYAFRCMRVGPFFECA